MKVEKALTLSAAVVGVIVGVNYLLQQRGKRPNEAPGSNFVSRLADDAMSFLTQDPAATVGTSIADVKLWVIGPPSVTLPAPRASNAPPGLEDFADSDPDSGFFGGA